MLTLATIEDAKRVQSSVDKKGAEGDAGQKSRMMSVAARNTNAGDIGQTDNDPKGDARAKARMAAAVDHNTEAGNTGHADSPGQSSDGQSSGGQSGDGGGSNCFPLFAAANNKPPSTSAAEVSAEAVANLKLQQQLEGMREFTRCPLCLVRNKNMALQCGRSTCQYCSDQLMTMPTKACPMCRKPIEPQSLLLFW